MTATLEPPTTVRGPVPSAPTTAPTAGPGVGPGVDPGVDPDLARRRTLRGVRRGDWLALVGSLVSALATTCLLFGVLTPLHGKIAFTIVGWLVFVATYALVVSLDEPLVAVVDRIAAVVFWSLGGVLVTVLLDIVVFTFDRGRAALVHPNFYNEDMTLAGPLDGLEVGGLYHAMVGTLEQITVALALTIPLGLLTAIFLSEFPGRFARFVRTVIEAMTALPSIIAGLFVYAAYILFLGEHVHVGHWRPGKSGLAASLAISVMMLPIIVRAADVVIRLVPAQLREASYALGTSRWRTVWHVVLPTARSGLTTAVILGTARGIGETSPVLLTAGAAATVNYNASEGNQVSLPLFIFESVKSPQPVMISRAFGGAAVLLALVLLLFVLARVVGGRGPGQESGRQRRRRVAASARDVRRWAGRAAVAAGVLGLALVPAVAPSGRAVAAPAGESYVPISGAGSTWSQNAVDQWRRNVNQYGMQVNYQGTGSSDGRTQFRNGTVDFAVTEIPYGLTDGGVYDAPPDRGYAYMPIVAGGTAFMYNLKIGGRRVTNLRLSGDTVAGIFTGTITRWDDPQIKQDNPSLALPPRTIVPVVRSDGSGTTAQLSTWLSQRHADTWNNYCATAGRASPCGVTSFYPVVTGSGFVAQAGSLGVSGFVSQEQNEGTITYVEYSYALNTNFPVAKILNKSGYYVEPKAESVAVGLLKARINTDASSSQYLTQILDGVYDNKDKRAYPLSSYSYMVVPTEESGSFNESKGKTLADFAYYFLCEGQQQAPILGYSPLPINLVKAGLSQVKRIPGVDVQSVDIADCNNPTFSADGTNVLAANAPYPADCDKQGPTQCSAGTGGAEEDTPPSDPNAPPADEDPDDDGDGKPDQTDTDGDGTPDATPTQGTGPDGGQAPGDVPSGGTAPVVDPETGQVIGGGPTTTTDAGYVATGQSVDIGDDGLEGLGGLLMLLAGLMLALAVVVPPLVAQRLGRRR